MNGAEPTEAEITDFIDGRLSAARRAEIERWLADHPARASEVERQRKLNEALKDLGAEILDEPVPERLREVLRRPSPRTTSGGGEGESENGDRSAASRRWFNGPIGAIALVLVGVALGWVVEAALEEKESAFETLLADASYAFSFYTQESDFAVQFPPERVAEFVAASNQLFERRVRPPDLKSAGFKFRGARIAPIGGRTSSFFFFEDQAGESLTVVVWPAGEQDPGTPGPGFRDLGDISARFWFSKGLAFAVMAEADQESLSEIGNKVVSFYGHDVGG